MLRNIDRTLDLQNPFNFSKNPNQGTPTSNSNLSKVSSFFNRPQTVNSSTRSQSIGVSQSQQHFHSYLSPTNNQPKGLGQYSQSKLDNNSQLNTRSSQKIESSNFQNTRYQPLGSSGLFSNIGSNQQAVSQKYLNLNSQKQQQFQSPSAQLGTQDERLRKSSLFQNQINNNDLMRYKSQQQYQLQDNYNTNYDQNNYFSHQNRSNIQTNNQPLFKNNELQQQSLQQQSPTSHFTSNGQVDINSSKFIQNKYKFFDDNKSPSSNTENSLNSYLQTAQKNSTQMSFLNQKQNGRTTDQTEQQNIMNSYIQKQQQQSNQSNSKLNYENYLSGDKNRQNDYKNRQLQIQKQQQASTKNQPLQNQNNFKTSSYYDGIEVPSSYLNNNSNNANRNAFQNISNNVMNQQNKQNEQNSSGFIIQKNNYFSAQQNDLEIDQNNYGEKFQFMSQKQNQQQRKDSNNQLQQQYEQQRQNSSQQQYYSQQQQQIQNKSGLNNNQSEERKSTQFQNQTSTGRFFSANKNDPSINQNNNNNNNNFSNQQKNLNVQSNLSQNQNQFQSKNPQYNNNRDSQVNNNNQTLQRKSNSTTQIQQNQTGFYQQYQKIANQNNNNNQIEQQDFDQRQFEENKISNFKSNESGLQQKQVQPQLNLKINNFMNDKNEQLLQKRGLTPNERSRNQQYQNEQQQQRQSFDKFNHGKPEYDQKTNNYNDNIFSNQQQQPQKVNTFLSGKIQTQQQQQTRNEGNNANLQQQQLQNKQFDNQQNIQKNKNEQSSNLDQFITRVNKNDPLAAFSKFQNPNQQKNQQVPQENGNQRQQNQQKAQIKNINQPTMNNNQMSNNNKKQLQLDEKDATRPNFQYTREAKSTTNNMNSENAQKQQQQQSVLDNKKLSPNTTTAAKIQNKHFFDKDIEEDQENKNMLMIQKYNQLKKKQFTYYQTNLEKHNKQVIPGDYFNQIYREHFIQTFQALTFCKLLKQVDPRVLQQKRVNLKKRESHKYKKTLIFDLDETLIHCNESLEIQSDIILPIKFPNGEIIEAGINIRPYATEILKEMSQHFEIVVFTASHGCYANKVLDYLDPREQYIHHRIFRDNCIVTEEGVYIKDLRIFEGCRNLEDLVIVDNACYSFGYHLENGIPIIPFYDNKSDEELKHLIPYLKQMVQKDIKELNRNTFKLAQYQLYDTPEQVIKMIFDSNN